MLKNRKYFVVFVFFIALLTGFGLFFVSNLQKKKYFSDSSLQSLQRLNSTQQIYMHDLLKSQDTFLQDELLFANVISPQEVSRVDHKGLIASLHDNTVDRDVFLLLEPAQPLPDSQLMQIAAEYKELIPEFVEVELDQDIQLTEAMTGDTDISLPKSSDQKENFEKSIRIGVIDSGLDTAHQLFKDKKIQQGWNALAENNQMYDDLGHGTHITGIIVSRMPSVSIIPYKVVSAEEGKLSDVIKALDKAIEDQVDVINMSLGFSSDSYALQEIVEEAVQDKIIIIAAAGNKSSSDPFYPASYDHVLAVAALNNFNAKMSKSNYGDWIDIAAPGYRVLSSLPNNLYGRKSGTSQATAVVTSLVADILMKSEGPLDSEEILGELKKHAVYNEAGLLKDIPLIQKEA